MRILITLMLAFNARAYVDTLSCNSVNGTFRFASSERKGWSYVRILDPFFMEPGISKSTVIGGEKGSIDRFSIDLRNKEELKVVNRNGITELIFQTDLKVRLLSNEKFPKYDWREISKDRKSIELKEILCLHSFGLSSN